MKVECSRCKKQFEYNANAKTSEDQGGLRTPKTIRNSVGKIMKVDYSNAAYICNKCFEKGLKNIIEILAAEGEEK